MEAKKNNKIHDHSHDDGCCCSHEHHEHDLSLDDGCCCGHEHHEHDHSHDDDCCCGHEHHEHGLSHDDDCCCGHDHHEHHEHKHHETLHQSAKNCEAYPDDTKKTTFILENLDCANCAAKMERKINQIPGIDSAVITFATKQLRICGSDIPSLLPQIEAACHSIEADVKLIPKTGSAEKTSDSLTDKHKTETSKDGHHKAKTLFSEQSLSLIEIIAGAILLIAGKITNNVFPQYPLISLMVFIIAYLILGFDVLWTAAKNMARGHVFDENFLMSIATIGAFVTKAYSEAVGVMLFYRIGEYFEDRAVAKSRSQIMDAIDMRPETVNLVNGSDIKVIPAQNAQVGDIVMIRPGDRIPLDGKIIEGSSRIDTSPVTGEPVPVKAECGDDVISGCVNTSGQIKIRVEKVLSESMVTRILDSVENAAASKPKIDRFITKFARIYTPVVVALAAATAVIPSLITGNWHYWVYTALTFLVMSCPCALVLSVPLAFFSGIGSGSKQGILFKGGASLEALNKVKAVVMDKTGTITEGNFKVQHILTNGVVSENDLLAIAASCELSSTHPIGASIVAAAREKNLSLVRPKQVEEIAGCGIRAVNNGQTVLCGNGKLLKQSGTAFTENTDNMYGTKVLVAIDGKYAGCIIIADTLKSDAKAAVSQLKQYGITPAMLTGDTRESAENIAKEAGISEVHAHLMPQDKLDILQSLRKQYGSVMFVGDGINDAPVLAGADVGAAMGSGADAAIEAADVVFMTSKMQAIPLALSIARKTARIALQNVIFALTIKIIVMILGLCGLASMWMAVFADSGVAMLCILNSIRILYKK